MPLSPGGWPCAAARRADLARGWAGDRWGGGPRPPRTCARRAAELAESRGAGASASAVVGGASAKAAELAESRRRVG